METLAKALNGQAESTIREAHTVLAGLVTNLQNSKKGPDDLKALDLIARSQLPLLAEVDGFYISDASGHYLLNTRVFDPTMNNSDREYFQYHRDHRNPDLYIGKPLQSKTTGQWIITLSMRIAGPRNEFEGVALATLNFQKLVSLYSGLRLGDEGIITFAKRDGTILARSQVAPRTFEINIADSPMLKMVNDGVASGTVTLNAMVDGVRRIYGFNASAEYPVLVAVAVSQDAALEAWKKRALAIYMFAGLGLLVVICFGVTILRALNGQARMVLSLHRTHESLAEANQALVVMAAEDALTGLANRRRLDETFDEAFYRAAAAGEHLAFVLIDVDHFKLFNDTYGHPAGDKALIQVAGVLRSVARREIDLAARYGGEEMALILPGADVFGASRVAEKVRVEVEHSDLPHAQSPAGRVTISLGVSAGVPGKDFVSPIEMVAAADQALYSAKHRGRNQIALAA